MAKVLVNLTNLEFVSHIDVMYMSPAPNGHVECGAVCPAKPHYRCSRAAHTDGNGNVIGDHAAHGAGRKMFARWRN